MPQSRKRKSQLHPTAGSAKAKKARSAVPVAGIFLCLLGMGIAYFAAGANLVWLSVGAVTGAVGGCLFGLQIDKSFSKK